MLKPGEQRALTAKQKQMHIYGRETLDDNYSFNRNSFMVPNASNNEEYTLYKTMIDRILSSSAGAKVRELLIYEGASQDQIDQVMLPVLKLLSRAVAKSKIPQWRDRAGVPALAEITAPEFLKTVYGDLIKQDGHVKKDVIRYIDKELMQAVEQYIHHRTVRASKAKVKDNDKAKQPLDLGDAEGIEFVSSRPAVTSRFAARRLRNG